MKSLMGLSILLATAGVAPSGHGTDVRPDEFQKLHDSLMKPESWEGVPWKSHLLEARTQAFKEKKPLLLWCMDAKPLGSV